MLDKGRFFEKLYFHELDRKQAIESNFSLPTGVIAGLFGLVGFFFTHFRFGGGEYAVGSVIELIFVMSAAVSFLLLILASWWCAKAIMGLPYEHLPGAETMSGYWSELLEWHREIGTDDPKQAANADFEIFLQSSIAKCSQINWKANLIRSEELFNTKRATVWALFSLAITAGSYYVHYLISPPTG